MKRIVVVIIMTVINLVGWSSCRFGNRADTVLDFIPGLYERTFDDSTGHGTIWLVITANAGNAFRIDRISKVVPRVGGREQPVVHDTVVWVAVYDARHRILHEQRKGKVLLFVPEDNRLLIGGTVYTKQK